MILRMKDIGFLLTLLLFCWSCTDVNDLGGDSSGGLLLRIKASSTSSFKADASQSDISNEDLQLFFFKADQTGQFLFTHSSDSQDLTVTSISSNQVEISTQVPFAPGTLIQFILVTNYKGNTPSKGQEIEDFSQNNLRYKLQGAWSSSEDIPMWGVNRSILQPNSTSSTVEMLRSLARVDVLIDTQDEEATYKMNKLESVRVYRTVNEVNLAVPADNMGSKNTVIKPTEVPGALYNVGISGTNNLTVADANPLVYNIDGGSNVGLANKIFIPEKTHKSDEKLSQAVTMVVGVSLEGMGDKEYFYRIDFGYYENEESLLPSSFYSILRNHLYRFKLRGATLLGADTPEEALQAKSTLWVGVETWLTDDVDVNINGQYSFRIDTSKILLTEDKGDEALVPFSTNIPDSDLEHAIVLTWGENEAENSDYFEASVDYVNHNISIKTKLANNTADERTDLLILSVFKQKFKIEVEQSDKTADYVITQKHYKVNGVYVNGQNLSSDNTITLRLYARLKTSQLKGLDYHITASPVDGIYIDYEGRFMNIQHDESVDLDYEEITVPILGKSTMAKDKLLTIVTDGASYSLLNVTIPYALGKKRILDFYGKVTSATQNIEQLVSLSGNFSLNSDAYVFSEGNELKHSQSTDMASEIAEYQPDVIIIRDNYLLQSDHIDILFNFMNARNEYRASNSVLIFTANPLVLQLFQKMNLIDSKAKLVELSLEPARNIETGFNEIIPEVKGVQTYYRYQIPVYTQNPISNGPFGNIGARYIALDKQGVYIAGMPDYSIFKFTGTVPFGDAFKTYDKGISMFSAYGCNLMWVGLDSFLTTEQDNWFFDGDKIVDYKAGGNDFTSYNKSGTTKMTLASNGILFANALYWALYSSEYKASN